MAQKHPAPPTDCQSRPWLTRAHGECAFPVSGEGAETFSCCDECAPRSEYCATHRKLIQGPRAPAFADLLREYARFLA